MWIDWALFQMAFNRDSDFHDRYPLSDYLDLQTGEVVRYYESDEDAEMDVGITAEDNQVARDRIRSDSERYLRIPGLSHGEHHEILKDFLDSHWTHDEELRRFARGAYHGSIGRWMQSVNDQSIVDEFYKYQELRLEEMGIAFLRAHGIEPTSNN